MHYLQWLIVFVILLVLTLVQAIDRWGQHFIRGWRPGTPFEKIAHATRHVVEYLRFGCICAICVYPFVIMAIDPSHSF